MRKHVRRLFAAFSVFAVFVVITCNAQTVRTQIGEVYVKENLLLQKNGAPNAPSLTGDQLVGALYNASHDGRYVLFGGAQRYRGTLLPQPALYVLDVRQGKVSNISKLLSLPVVSGNFSPVKSEIALMTIDGKTIVIASFPDLQITHSIKQTDPTTSFDFGVSWNRSGDKLLLRLSDVQCDHAGSRWQVFDAKSGAAEKLITERTQLEAFVDIEEPRREASLDTYSSVGQDFVIRLPYPTDLVRSVTQGFSYNGSTGHKGIDFGLNRETVVASAPGRVLADLASPDNGIHVRLWHQGLTKQWISTYLHLESKITKAQSLYEIFEIGEPLGISGNTGQADGYHLHWQVNEFNSTASQSMGTVTNPVRTQGYDEDSHTSPISEFQLHRYRAVNALSNPPLVPDLICLASSTGAPVGGAQVKLTDTNPPVTATSTFEGKVFFHELICGNHWVDAVLGALHFSGYVNFQCNTSTDSKSLSVKPNEVFSSTAGQSIEMSSGGACPNSSTTNFVIGDRIEVYGTGNGLRARYPNPCTDPPYAVMPDLAVGTVVGASQCCSGYIRWKIHYDDLPGVDVWSAEGEPNTGQIFLRKKQSSTCSYSLAPGRLDLDTNGAAASGFNVTTAASCYWTAVSSLDWISITTNSSGTGPAQVTFSVGANNTPYSRIGNIVVGDQTFIVTQPGNGSTTSGWALTVASSNPNSGVSVAVSPNDINGLGNGVTSFTRNYNAYTQAYLTAPAGVGSTTFQKWQRDGVDWSPSTATDLTMEGNHTMTAVYIPIPDRYLAVFIAPQQVVDAGAKWYIQGNGPYSSGQSIGPFSPGSTIQSGFSYTPIAGWIAPPDHSVTIANSGPTIVRVNYTLVPTLSLSTNQINVGSSSGGANLLVTNSGGGDLNWSASTASSWITLELSSGTATAGATNPLSFSFLANNSSLDRTGTINLSAPGAIGSPQSITLSQRGKMQVVSVQRSAHSFTLSWTADPSHTYGVFRSIDLSFASYDVIAAGIPGNVATYTDTSLSDNTPYMFYKVALDDGTLSPQSIVLANIDLWNYMHSLGYGAGNSYYTAPVPGLFETTAEGIRVGTNSARGAGNIITKQPYNLANATVEYTWSGSGGGGFMQVVMGPVSTQWPTDPSSQTTSCVNATYGNSWAGSWVADPSHVYKSTISFTSNTFTSSTTDVSAGIVVGSQTGVFDASLPTRLLFRQGDTYAGDAAQLVLRDLRVTPNSP